MSKTTVSNEISILKKQDILLVPIQNFFNNEKHLDLLLGILITGKYKISLRIIDWFVTNYSKKHNLVLNNNKPFIVYLEYKSQLKAYSKKQFDPFCRRSRIYYEYAKDKTFETTIGQLNFFRWAIQNKIIDYIMKNYETIEKDMNDTIKISRSSDSSPKTPSSLDSNGSSSIQLESIESNSINESSTNSKDKEVKPSKKKSTITATKNICKHNVKIIVSFD
jgi:hypothetical protein